MVDVDLSKCRGYDVLPKYQIEWLNTNYGPYWPLKIDVGKLNNESVLSSCWDEQSPILEELVDTETRLYSTGKLGKYTEEWKCFIEDAQNVQY